MGGDGERPFGSRRLVKLQPNIRFSSAGVFRLTVSSGVPPIQMLLSFLSIFSFFYFIILVLVPSFKSTCTFFCLGKFGRPFFQVRMYVLLLFFLLHIFSFCLFCFCKNLLTDWLYMNLYVNRRRVSV